MSVVGLERHGICRARPSIQHGDLAENRAGTLVAQRHFAPVADAKNDSHAARDDDVEAVAVVAP
jgi:hypothetical protein